MYLSPVSEAKKRANKKWHDANYTQVKLSMPNEEAEILDYSETPTFLYMSIFSFLS